MQCGRIGANRELRSQMSARMSCVGHGSVMAERGNLAPRVRQVAATSANFRVSRRCSQISWRRGGMVCDRRAMSEFIERVVVCLLLSSACSSGSIAPARSAPDAPARAAELHEEAYGEVGGQ